MRWSRTAMRPMLLLVLTLWLALCDAGQNLRKTTCPICDMDVKSTINATILGSQLVYACEMAGHIDALQNEPSSNLGGPIESDITTDEIYKDATDITCPVCNKAFSELKYAVPWISQGAQKIYTCSQEHADLVFANPKSYISVATETDGFCYSGAAANPQGSVMFNGFQLAAGSRVTCALLLFQPWVLSSGVKYAFGLIGVVLLAVSLEAMAMYRESVEKSLFQKHGRVVSLADYRSLDTPSQRRMSASNKAPPPLQSTKVTLIRRIPLWCKCVLAALYTVNLALAYFVMLVIMMFETALFLAVILGLGLGFLLFKDTEADTMSGSVDPCCSI